MESQAASTAPRVTGVLLTSCFVVMAVGGAMFAARNGMAGQPAPSFTYLALERGFVMAAVIITALGLAMLAALVGQAHHDALIPARLAAAAYVVATVVLLIGEASELRHGRYPDALVSGLRSGQYADALIVAYVVLAFLAQAAFGVILLRTGFLPAWIGWTAIVWNLAWPVILPLLTPRDVYLPVLHHVIPLLVGIALLWRG